MCRCHGWCGPGDRDDGVRTGGAAGGASAAWAASGPVITTQPHDETVPFAKRARFTVAASGSPRPTYQWQVAVDGVTFTDLAGATGDSLTVTGSLADDGAKDRAVVTNASGSATSAPADLELGPSKQVAAIKPLVTGLVDKGSQAAYQTSSPFPVTPTAELDGYGSAFSGIVVNVTRAQLERRRATSTSATWRHPWPQWPRTTGPTPRRR